MIKSNKLKVGIAGYGVVGQKRRIFIDKNQSLELIAVSDNKFSKDGTFVEDVSHDDYYLVLSENYYNRRPLS